jgi:hypothetical protein
MTTVEDELNLHVDDLVNYNLQEFAPEGDPTFGFLTLGCVVTAPPSDGMVQLRWVSPVDGTVVNFIADVDFISKSVP